jgi:hypothetical protein
MRKRKYRKRGLISREIFGRRNEEDDRMIEKDEN